MSDETPKKARVSWALIVIMVVIVTVPILLVADFYAHNGPQAQKTARRNACIANLKQIDAAIQGWALENKRSTNDAPELAGFVRYLRGSQLPVCPAKGIYHLGRTLMDPPTCTIPGHTL